MMGNNPFTGHALCQALRLEDIPHRPEASIEHRLRCLWDSNGPDFVLDYLKVLKKDTEESLVDPEHVYAHQDGEISVAWNHKLGRPKGPLGYIYRRFPDPAARIRVIGAAIQAITYEHATKHQLEKFKSNVRSDTRSDKTIRFSDRLLQKLEKRLTVRLREVSRPFGPADLTNNVLPLERDSVQTSANKSTLRTASLVPSLATAPQTYRAVLELYADAVVQLYTAPRISKTHWNSLVSRVNGDKVVKVPRKVRLRPFMARDYDGDWEMFDDTAEYSAPGKADFVGRLDFLQKPGGKLRSVANINRFVNYTMAPYAKALEDVFYSFPQVSVKDQHDGLRWAQRQLRFGENITSLDLSAATDTLDYRVFTRGLKRDFPGKTGLLEEYATYFEELSSLPLWCDGINSPVQFKTGQPLGMKGSFQTLTAMNLFAGLIACKRSGHQEDSFRVVGDDFVCHSEIAAAYSDTIQSWGGTTNVEKAMQSNKYAEFLSHIVSKDKVYITKPKYRPGNKLVFSNLDKAKVRSQRGIYRLTPSEADAVDIMSAYSVDEMDFRANLPHFRSKDYEMDDYSLSVMSAALDVVAELRQAHPDEYQVNSIIFDYLEEADPSILDRVRESLDVERIPSGLVRGDTTTMPVSTEVYDHKIGKQRAKTSKSQDYKSALSKADDMRKIDKVLTTGEDEPIDIGSVSLPASEIALQALEQEAPDRKTAATVTQERGLPDLSGIDWSTAHLNDEREY